MPTGCADHSAANLPSAHCDLDELPHITMELALCTNDEGCFLINGIWHCSYVVEYAPPWIYLSSTVILGFPAVYCLRCN